MKKIIVVFAVALLFITCKKDQKVPSVIDATGTWTLYSWDSDAPPFPTHTNADQHPCMAENVITFNKDQMVTRNYAGKDTCFVAASPIT